MDKKLSDNERKFRHYLKKYHFTSETYTICNSPCRRLGIRKDISKYKNI